MHKKTLQFRDKKLLFSCDHHFEKTLNKKKKEKKNSRELDQVTYHSKTNKIECMDI